MGKGYFYYKNTGDELQPNASYIALDKTTKLFIREVIDLMIRQPIPGLINNNFKAIAKMINFRPEEVKRSIKSALISGIICLKSDTNQEQIKITSDTDLYQICFKFDWFLCYPPLQKHALNVSNGQKGGRPDLVGGSTQRIVKNNKEKENIKEKKEDTPVLKIAVSSEQSEERFSEQSLKKNSIEADEVSPPPSKAEKEIFFIKLFNETKGSKEAPARYRLNDKLRKSLHARLKDGYTSADIRRAILRVKADPWHQENGLKYLTPEFILRPDMLEKWSNAPLLKNILPGETQVPKENPNLKTSFF